MERIAALRALSLLDTPSEERFDRITRLARRVFGTDIALFSLVDSDRQWFKSRQGLDASETPRDISFCGHAIMGDEALVVPDTHDDVRFADNPLVTEQPSIRFYAGCPISAPGGRKIGTLCVIDPAPRDFDAEDVRVLQDLAQTLEDEIAAMGLASQDELTGLTNRRGLLLDGAKSLAICRRAKLPAHLLFFDLDGFKAINDTLGHAMGDRALREFSDVLVEVFRESDLVARVGGDEFCVLATGTDAEACAAPLARLATKIAARNDDSTAAYRLDYSVGAVEFDPETHKTIEHLIEAADAGMYAMKKSRD